MRSGETASKAAAALSGENINYQKRRKENRNIQHQHRKLSEKGKTGRIMGKKMKAKAKASKIGVSKQNRRKKKGRDQEGPAGIRIGGNVMSAEQQYENRQTAAVKQRIAAYIVVGVMKGGYQGERRKAAKAKARRAAGRLAGGIKEKLQRLLAASMKAYRSVAKGGRRISSGISVKRRG